MRNRLVTLLTLALALLFIPHIATAQSNSGLVLVESGYAVDETVSRLTATLEEKGLIVVGTVDHAANAASVDLELLPTQLIIFGNPNLGTPLMQNSRSVAIDLPQKYLVWEDISGRTFVTYNGVPYLTDRHGLTGPEDVLTTVTGALANFAGTVAPAAPEPEPTEAPVEEPEPTEVPAEEPEPTEVPAEEPEPTAVPVEEPVDAEPADEEPAVLPITGASNSTSTTIWVVLAALFIGALLMVAPGLRKNLAKNKIISFLLFGLMLGLAAGIPSSAEADGHAGLVATNSPYTAEETVERLQAAIESRNLKIMMVIDHAANAAKVDKELPPTQLIFFGNPAVGTQLMQASRSVAIDLPQKMLVWDDGDGNVQVIYNEPVYLAERHDIIGKDQVIANVSNALNAIAEEATAGE